MKFRLFLPSWKQRVCGKALFGLQEKMKNIFEKIVTKENDFSNLIVNALGDSTFRKVFLEVVIGTSKDINPEQVSTQYVSRGNGNPDIFFESDELSFLVEVKTENNTGLQSNQPDGYLVELAGMPGDTKVLTFLVPAEYSHSEELFRRIETKNVRLVYWEDLIRRLLELRRGMGEIHNSVIDYLSDFFCYSSVSYREKDMNYYNNMELAEYFRNVKATILNMEKRVRELGFTTKREIDVDNFGFYINDPRKKESLCWFGTFDNLWFKKGVGLCFLANITHGLSDQLRGREVFEERGNTYYFDYVREFKSSTFEQDWFDLISRELKSWKPNI